jgi:hypothetical protein
VAALFWIAALWQTWRQPSPANRHWVSSGRGAGDGPMTREDALALLDAMCRDPTHRHRSREKMAALFVAVTSDDPMAGPTYAALPRVQEAIR